MLRALILDVDGTLAETEEAHRTAFNHAFAELALPWRWDQPLYRDLLGVAGGKERLRAFLEREEPGRATDALVAALHRRKTAHYTTAVARGDVPFRPGVAPLITQALVAGITLAIATTTSRVNVEALFAGNGDSPPLAAFAAVMTAEDAPAKKPDPQVYHRALDALALPPAACLAIEDSVNGLSAALAAGIPTLVTESAYTAGDDFTGALAVLTDLSSTGLDAIRRLHAGGDR
ncbi:HAD-IA family hydrolase [Azospirillum sp. RWY-5-1]|uniref:HAD-IA family hydrolase n=1 Tax=Azospirillum oleiclasticum TaxID=2735135 RepID=A0ABX2T9X2_9PROT|nr:HAD-IA family hydrolase [Azospirillum oleiclasticum]NYZ12793.1 HAD-IA family hydrolase [Azospirillum oleiclasticum]NYZ19953.1 HAD-IA family hydrolase [Azospirillum oleiclasticum]